MKGENHQFKRKQESTGHEYTYAWKQKDDKHYILEEPFGRGMETQDFTKANRAPAQRSYSVSAHRIMEVALIIQEVTLYVLHYRKTLRKDMWSYSDSHQVIPVVGSKFEEMNIFPQ